MPRLKENEVPTYRLHRQSGQAIVTLNGKDVLLGKHESPQSKAEYRRLTAEWLATKGMPPTATGEDLAVKELVLAFWRHAKAYYRKNGKPTSERAVYKMLLKVLKELYGHVRAADFGPKSLKAMAHEMIRKGWVRSSINKHLGRIRHVFKWGVENELVPASVYHGLLAVSGLPKGRTDAEESEPVMPVPEAHVDAILPHVSKQVKAMVELQLLTGGRPGEVCAMRGCDLDTTGKLWTYTPASHKTEHHDHRRTLYLGPRAQDVVKPFLKTNTTAYLFSPIDAESERLAALHAKRIESGTPIEHGNAPGTNRKRRPKRRPQDRYTVASYRRAIQRGCEIAFGMPDDLYEPRGKKARKAEAELPPEEQKRRRQERAKGRAAWREENYWNPHQLRHNAGTRLRKEYGLEAAQVILGHKSLSVTEIYAEKNVAAAQRIMAEVG